MHTRNDRSTDHETLQIEQSVSSTEIGKVSNNLIESLDEIQNAFKTQMQNQVSEFKPTENFPEYLKPNLENQSIFYVVGELVAIKEKSQESFFPLGGKFQFRKCIPDDEIRQAFPSGGMTKLFLNEYDAVQYSSANRIGKIDENKICFQSPIFTVECLDSIDKNLAKAGRVFINEKNNKSEELIFFFEQDINKIIPHRGQMIIQKNLFFSMDYPLISFTDENEFSLIDLRPNREQPDCNQCRVM